MSGFGWLHALIERIVRWWMVRSELATDCEDTRQAVVDLLFTAAWTGRPSEERLKRLHVQLLRLPWLWDEPCETVQGRLRRARRRAMSGEQAPAARALERIGPGQRTTVFAMVLELLARDRSDGVTVAFVEQCGGSVALSREAAREALRDARFAEAPEL